MTRNEILEALANRTPERQNGDWNLHIVTDDPNIPAGYYLVGHGRDQWSSTGDSFDEYRTLTHAEAFFASAVRNSPVALSPRRRPRRTAQ